MIKPKKEESIEQMLGCSALVLIAILANIIIWVVGLIKCLEYLF